MKLSRFQSAIYQIIHHFFSLSFTIFSSAKALTLGQDIPYFYYEDETGSFSLDQFLVLPQETLIQSKKTLSKGYTKSTFWIKFNVNDKSFYDDEYWFEILPVYLDRIEFHYKENGLGNIWNKRYAGDLYNKEDWDLHYRAPVFILPKSKKGYSVIMKVTTSSSLFMNLNIWKEYDFIESSLKENISWSFLFGVFIFLGVLLLFLSIFFNKRFSIILFLSFFVYLDIICMHGYYGWFFPSLYKYQNELTSISFFIIFSIVLLASSEILQLNRKFNKIYGTVFYISFCISFQSIFVFFDMYYLSIKIAYFYFFIGCSLIIYCYLYNLFRINFSIYYLVVGMVPMIVIFVLSSRILVLNGWVDYPEKQAVYWKFFAVIGAIVVIGGILVKAYKEKLLRVEKIGLIRELNIEREARFYQRQLVSIVSHEFRTSLAIISGALTNLKNFSNINFQVAKRYDRIERANERLIQLTDNCLADDRVSSSHTMIFKKTDLSVILISAQKLVGLSEHHKVNITLDHIPVTLSELPELFIKADEAMLKIAFSNVFDNALKYMEEGDLDVNIYHNEFFYIINVTDHGIGIDKGKEEEIFERYKQVSRDNNEIKPGVGFGLYICKKIMLGHGGDIRLVDSSNKGCCFEFKIPKKLS